MTSRPFVFVVFLTGVSMLSTVVVVGFVNPSLSTSASGSSFGAIATTLRYAAETSFQDEQYYRSRPNDMKVVDVEVESKSQYVYIPQNEMADAMNKAEKSHEEECEDLQKVIDEQQQELQRLKERNQKAHLAERMQYDHLSEDTEVSWDENHDEKMKRTTDRLVFLTSENRRLQAELEEERVRFELERGRLQQKVEEAREEAAEAHHFLCLERSYFETATQLLEVGLERETNNVKALEDRLMQTNQQGFHGTPHHHQPYSEDTPHFETLGEPSGAYEQQQGHNHHHHHHPGFHHYQHHHEEQFEPRVRPQGYHQENYIEMQHEESFQSHQPQSFHMEHDVQTTQQHSGPGSDAISSHRERVTATTTTMGASSIGDTVGINHIRDSYYR